jgi:DNA-binding transcriptional LysR family regulator
VQVAELGSLTKAARLHGSAQSAISRQISALEREYGGRLFYRTGHGVVLSELGERVFPRVKGWLAESEQLENEIRAAAGVPVGVVRLGVLPALAPPVLGPLFPVLRERYTGVRLHVREGSSNQLHDWLANGQLDVAVLLRDVPHNGGGETTLATVDAHLVGAAGDALTGRDTVRFGQLAGLPLIVPALPNGMRVALEEHAKRKGVSLNVVMETDSLAVQKELVARTGCYTVIAYHAALEEVRRGVLQASRLVNPGINRLITLVVATRRPATLAIQEVVKLMPSLLSDQIARGALPRRR